MEKNYYKSITPIFLKSRITGKALTSRFGKNPAKLMLAEISKRYAAFVNELPLFDGKKNMNSRFIVEAAYLLAFYQTLKIHSLTLEQIGEIYYNMWVTFFNFIPKCIRFIVGKYRYGPIYIGRLKKYSLETQKRIYPDGYVLTYIDGDGKDFDFGYDYSECAALNFFNAHGAGELAPIFCFIDYPISRAFKRGLVREKTLALGADKCEFRYKKGRETKETWPPDFLKS